ncbi:25850_t:CDS:1, partial [Racocetra persica]
LSEGESNISIIELDLISTADHENKVYCKYFLCANKDYSGAWVSKSIQVRHKKAQCIYQKSTTIYSEPLNL